MGCSGNTAGELAALADRIRASAQSLVDHPSLVKVEWTTGAAGMVLALEVDPSEIGQMLGQHGCHMRALRVLASSVGGRLEKRVDLLLHEPAAVGVRSQRCRLPPEQSDAPDPFAAMVGHVEEWVRLLVDSPDEVRVSLRTGQRAALVTVQVHPNEYRQVLGRCGQVANALRTILEPVAARQGRKLLLELVDPRLAVPLPAVRTRPDYSAA